MQERYVFEDEHLQNVFNYKWHNNLLELTKDNMLSTISFASEFINGNQRIIFTDIDHPYAIVDWVMNISINIDEDYFLANKDDVIKQIVLYINSYTKDTIFIINKELITTEIIEAIANNPYIKKVNLGSIQDAYSLTLTDYRVLKEAGKTKIKTDIVDKDVEEIFDPIIPYNMNKKLLGNNDYNNLQGNSFPKDTLTLSEPVPKENFRYLKHIKDGITITFKYENYDNIYNVISQIQNLGKKVVFNFLIDDKKDLLTNFLVTYASELESYPIRCVEKMDETYTVTEYLSYEKRLYNLAKPAMHLSPLERYLYAYHVVKRYKQYKENLEDPFEARSLYRVLDGEYMVCRGYSVLLGDLLDKLNIPSSEYGITVDTTFDKYSNQIEKTSEDLSVSHAGHARRLVNLVDSKYRINGIYISDPTWDNDLIEDTYCFALLTPNEAITGKRYLHFDGSTASELLFVNSIEEFYSKINFILDHNLLFTPNSKDKYVQELNVIGKLLVLLKRLDTNFFDYFLDKYQILRKSYKDRNFDLNYITQKEEYDKKYIQDMLLELGEYIVNKVNKTVDKETLRAALTIMYKEGYNISSEEAINKTEEALEATKKKMIYSFPKREIIYQDGTKEIYDNEYNKFAEESRNIKL